MISVFNLSFLATEATGELLSGKCLQKKQEITIL